MRFSLSDKNKLGFVEGSIHVPSDLDIANKWDRCNSLMMSLILNSMNKSLYSNVVFNSKTSDVWVDLLQTYCKIDETRMFSLLQDISRINQGVDYIFVYYMKLKILLR